MGPLPAEVCQSPRWTTHAVSGEEIEERGNLLLLETAAMT
jgi:hypothetical protein